MLEELNDWTVDSIHVALFDVIAKKEVKNGYILWPIRTALSGKQFTPGIELCAILGRMTQSAGLKLVFQNYLNIIISLSH